MKKAHGNLPEKKLDPNTIHKNLRCLVCQGQSIADSNSDFAQTIKLVVKDLIKDVNKKDAQEACDASSGAAAIFGGSCELK